MCSNSYLPLLYRSESNQIRVSWTQAGGGTRGKRNMLRLVVRARAPAREIDPFTATVSTSAGIESSDTATLPLGAAGHCPFHTLAPTNEGILPLVGSTRDIPGYVTRGTWALPPG